MGKLILDVELRAVVILFFWLAGWMRFEQKEDFLSWFFFAVGVVAFAFFGLRI